MKKAIKKKPFKERCAAAAKIAGVHVSFHPDRRKSGPYEDDGSLHVIERGVRACFDVCGDAVIQNERTVNVLNALGMGDKINANTLIDEPSEDEDDSGDVCPHCGRSSQYD